MADAVRGLTLLIQQVPGSLPAIYLSDEHSDDDTIETYRIDCQDGVPQHIATSKTAGGPTWITAIAEIGC